MSDSASSGAPSNSALAERTARIEENVQHVAETVERIEESVTEGQEDLAMKVESNTRALAETDEKVTTLFKIYAFLRWAIPVGATVAGALGTLVAAGVV